MKYIITESQFDKVIFKYLDNQDFIQIEKGKRIYFVNSETDKYAQIRYDKSDGWCGIYYRLVDEISTFFSLREPDSKEVINRWVENTLQMKVTYTQYPTCSYGMYVENTLQMKVTYTYQVNWDDGSLLRIPN